MTHIPLAKVSKVFGYCPSLGKVPKAEGVSVCDIAYREPIPYPSQKGNFRDLRKKSNLNKTLIQKD